MTDATVERGRPGSRARRPLVKPTSASEAERRELVFRIVQSTTFGRSERLGALLTYVCEMALKGRGSELNEQKIGTAVFGRSPDYDSAVDGIVRSQASRLRQRLDLYFQQEGSDEPIRVVIPRGGYVPVFETQERVPEPAPPTEMPNAEEAVAVPIGLPSPGGTTLRRSLPWALTLVMATLLAASLLHGVHRQALPSAGALPVHPLWSHLFSASQPTTIVAPDSGLVIFRGLSGQKIDLKQYLDAGYRSDLNGPPEVTPTAPAKSWLLNLANRRYTSMVDVDAILALKDRALGMGGQVTVRYARDLRPNDLKSGSAILLGMSSANPWVELFENDMNFVLNDDFVKYGSVENRHPKAGEPAQWVSLRNDPQRRTFGVVAYVSNPAHDGDVLLIEGISMSGTEAAMDFVNDDAQLLPFLQQVRRPDGSLPHFEVLLETHNMGASAVRSQILSWRTSR